jgi:hypothetical protein
MLVRLIGWNKRRFDSVIEPIFGTKFYTDYRAEISR